MKIGSSLRKRSEYKAHMLDEILRMPGLLTIVTNAAFELFMANDYFYAYFDCQPDMLVGKPLYAFFSDDIYNDLNEKHIERVVSEGFIWDFDARTTRADGETVLIRWNHAVFYDDNKQLNILSVGIVQSPSVPETVTVDNKIPDQRGFSVIPIHSQYVSGIEKVDGSVTEDEIQYALEHEGIALFFQPIVSSRTKKIVGAEALVRLIHPVRGVLGPKDFITVAEQTGQIIPIGEYVIKTACKKINQWNIAGLPLFLSINISTQQFIHVSFTETLLHAITKYDVAAGQLLLEITEDTTSRDWNKVQEVLQILRSMGCRISLDDFGTSLASFHYLEQLDIDNIKIDRAFLSNALVNRKSFAIIESIIVLAHGLGISVTAEGVETQAQLSFLLDKACDYLQGYLLSHPLPAIEFDRLISDNPGFYVRNM